MKTLLIVDGDIVFNNSTGLQVLVGDESKANQDVAETLLTEYNAYFNEGNELLTLASSLTGAGLNEALAYQYLYEAVNRLITSQRLANLDQQIIRIIDIKTRMVGLSSLVFLIQVLFDNGNIISVVDKVQTKVSINQTPNLNGLIGA